jgi:hypothetical protein
MAAALAGIAVGALTAFGGAVAVYVWRSNLVM